MKKQAEQLAEILAPGGMLAKVIESYDARPQQLEMGQQVFDALFHEQILIAEAPTGVGKTMAYLVPAALYARKRREPVVISSYTRALQDQIIQQDAPRLRRLIHPELAIALLKGRSNYLCRRRWDLFVAEEGATADGRWVVEKLEGWVNGTQTGAFSEAPDLGRRAGWVYGRIGGDARFCRSRLCRADGGCFHKLARRHAREADLVVVNHFLLMADAFGGGILPDHEALIVDEAHLLPDAALDPLTREVSERGFEERVRQMGGTGDPGASDRMRRALARLPSKVAAGNLRGELRDLEEQTRTTLAETRAFFGGLRAAENYPPEGERRRYTQRDTNDRMLPEGTDLFLKSTRDLATQGRRVLRTLATEVPSDESFQDVHDSLEAAEVAIAELAEATETIEALLTPEPHGRVYVLGATRTRGAHLSSMPLDPGPALREHLLETRSAVVMTSATLSAEDDFTYFARQVGLEEGEAITYHAASPFDLQRQLLAAVLRTGIDPRNPGYERYLAQTIAQLAAAVPRKMLVLFTSYRTLQRVEEDLKLSDEMADIEILAQDRDTPRAKLMEAFRDSDRAVLLGAGSFWQGVDFPGRELEMLVVTRLPFPVPTDPRVEAISEALEEEGRSSFREYSLPEAVLRFRQGVGRLIRRRGDRGLCVVLDARMATARYGRIFTQALPVAPIEVATSDELVARAQAWFAESGGEGCKPPR